MKTYYEVQKRGSLTKGWERSFRGNPGRYAEGPDRVWATSITAATRRACEARRCYATLEYRIAKLPAIANINTMSFNRVVKVVRQWKALKPR